LRELNVARFRAPGDEPDIWATSARDGFARTEIHQRAWKLHMLPSPGQRRKRRALSVQTSQIADLDVKLVRLTRRIARCLRFIAIRL